MANVKLVIVLSQKGLESVTVSAVDSPSRAFGYELCKRVETELTALSEAVKEHFTMYQKRQKVKQ